MSSVGAFRCGVTSGFSSRQPFSGTKGVPTILHPQPSLPFLFSKALLLLYEQFQTMASPNPPEASMATTFQYAVPVTIESFGKGFVAHYFWAPRYWIPQLRTFRWALYTVENPHSPSRRLLRRLPPEILNIIVQQVKDAAVEQGFRDCEQRMGVLKSSADLEIEDGIARLEKQGRSKGDFIVRPIDDAVYPSQSEIMLWS